MPQNFPPQANFPDSDTVTLKRILNAVAASNAGAQTGVATGNPGLFPEYVVGNLGTTSAELTRPNNSTNYSVGAVLARSTTIGAGNGLLTFNNVARVGGGSGYIQRVRVVVTGAISANSAINLHLWWAMPDGVNSISDNETFFSSFANRTRYVGMIALPGFVSFINSSMTDVYPVNLPYTTGSLNQLYGMLVLAAPLTLSGPLQFYVEIMSDRY